MNHPLILEAMMIQQLTRQRVLSEWEREALERRERDGGPVRQPTLLDRARRRMVAWATMRRRRPATSSAAPVEA